MARRVVAAPVGALGYDLVRRHFYSPIPDLARLPTDVWTRESELAGIDFDPAAGLKFLEKELAPYLDEYRPPLESTGSPRDYYLNNSLYESVDAETLYAIVRRFAPRRIIELGSGMSTLVIADARERNGNPDATKHDVYDPFARPDLADVLTDVARLHPVGATEVPRSDFAKLEAGDLLFVDTTHTVKVGGEVNRIILEILPLLAPGVLIHVHDIFLPWEYPKEFMTERRFFWAEQYLLQAFLAYNDEFEILFSAHALQRLYPTRVSRLVPSAGRETRPAAFWLRRVEPKSVA